MQTGQIDHTAVTKLVRLARRQLQQMALKVTKMTFSMAVAFMANTDETY